MQSLFLIIFILSYLFAVNIWFTIYASAGQKLSKQLPANIVTVCDSPMSDSDLRLFEASGSHKPGFTPIKNEPASSMDGYEKCTPRSSEPFALTGSPQNRLLTLAKMRHSIAVPSAEDKNANSVVMDTLAPPRSQHQSTPQNMVASSFYPLQIDTSAVSLSQSKLSKVSPTVTHSSQNLNSTYHHGQKPKYNTIHGTSAFSSQGQAQGQNRQKQRIPNLSSSHHGSGTSSRSQASGNSTGVSTVHFSPSTMSQQAVVYSAAGTAEGHRYVTEYGYFILTLLSSRFLLISFFTCLGINKWCLNSFLFGCNRVLAIAFKSSKYLAET